MKNKKKLETIIQNVSLKDLELEQRELWLRAKVAMEFVSLREKKKMTLVAVASKMGVSFQQVAKFENLVNSPTLTFLVKYAIALGTNVKIMLEGSDLLEVSNERPKI